MTGNNGVMEADDIEFLTYKRGHPYKAPGQICEDPEKGRSGPCEPGVWSKYAQCELPLMYSRVAIKGTVTAANDPIVFAATAAPLQLFTTGLAGDSAAAGYPDTIQDGVFSSADTSVAENVTGAKGASLAPDNDMVFRTFGVSMGFQQTFTVNGARKQYFTDWLRPYLKEIQEVLLTELTTKVWFGSTIIQQLFGPPVLYRKSNFQDNNPEAGSPIYTRCEFVSGAPNDQDRLRMEVALPFDVEIGNNADSPTVAASTVYAQLVVYFYGGLECRDAKGLICAPPGLKRANEVAGDVANLQAQMAQMAKQQAELMALLRAKG